MGFKCCVPGCNNSGKNGFQMHRFPNNQQLCNQWLTLIGRLDLKQKPLQRIRELHRICNAHFGAEAAYVGSRHKSTIKKNAVPSLLLVNSPDNARLDVPVADPVVTEDIQFGASSTSSNIDSFIDGQQIQSNIAQSSDGISRSITPTKNPLEHVSTPAKISNLKRRVSLLYYTGTQRAKILTPKAKKYYKIASDLRKTARRLNYNCENLRDKIKGMEKVANSDSFLKVLNPPTYHFVMSQLRCQKLNPKGRRFTLDEKILFLSFLKQSPKGYRLFRRIFAAPSRKTLTNLLRSIPFKTGLNNTIMESLKTKSQKMASKDKLCSIVFDEMQLDPILEYKKGQDIINGFQDNGESARLPIIADKAMVFMACGICKKWKQPICYYFNEGAMKTDVLAKTIKEVVKSCIDAGLSVKSIVCDQGSANIAAINKLYAETRAYFVSQGKENKMFGLLIGKKEIVPLYDCPHLLKSLRNNFFKYPAVFKWRGEDVEVAYWDHLVKLFEVEQAESDDYRLCRNLTLHHVKNTKKMKVSVAAQVFSNNVAAVLKRMACNESEGIPKKAASTAEFLLFIDKVFDSVNGACLSIKSGKILRCAVTEKSGHRVFWAEAIKVFQSMYFLKNDKKFITPSLKNWVHTLKGISYLWDKLSGEGVKFLCTRNLNQDPLENFFGKIRSHGIRNINPDALSFSNSFKSLIITNYLSNQTPSFNCETDDFQGLDDLKHMLTSHGQSETKNIIFPNVSIPEFKPEYSSLLKKGKLTYIAGFVAKKVFQKIKACSQCKSDLLSSDRSRPEHFLINARAYSPNALLSPSTNFNLMFQKCIDILSNVLPQICYYSNILQVLKTVLKNVCKDAIFNCKNHDAQEIIFEYTSKFHLFIWIKNVNSILKGKQILGDSSDPIKLYAKKKFETHQKLKKKMQTVKCLTV